VVFLSPPGEWRENTSKLGHNCFLPNRFHFIIRLSPTHSTPYILCHWKKSLNKLQKIKQIVTRVFGMTGKDPGNRERLPSQTEKTVAIGYIL
jgi:hypothetical protein